MIKTMRYAMVTLLVFSAQQVVCVYKNQIVQVRKIQGKNQYSVIITFEQSAPILTYAPASFEESQNDTVYRCFMPNTTVIESLENIEPETMQQLESGTVLILQGTLLRKIVGDRTILIQMGA